MAHWEARAEFLLRLAYNFRGKGSFLGNIFGFYKTRQILLSNSANCTVLCAVVLTQYRPACDGQTDRRTDGIAVASIALASASIVRSVKNSCNKNRLDDVLADMDN